MAGKSKRKQSKKKNKDCSRCTRNGEAFRCFSKQYVFDVDLAREIVSDGREKVELEPDDVLYSIDHCEINEKHLEHVNPVYPGIVAHLYFPDPDTGKKIHAHRLIDGHHRATLCHRRGEPFYVYVLNEEESVRILLRSPNGSIPDELQPAAELQAAR
jgi:hypothetical protein